MRRKIAALGLAAVLATGIAGRAEDSRHPSDPPVETERNSTLRAVYFPFLVVGHGLLLLGKYVIAYPIYYAFKPAYDLLYESSEDPEEIRRSRAEKNGS
jgi:hypothetical protein